MAKSETSAEVLELKLNLYRKLLSLIRKSRPEQAVIQFVVDSIWEIFPQYRVVYSVVSPDGHIQILYSRETEGQPNLTGISGNLSRAPLYLNALLNNQVVVVEDSRTHEMLAPLAEVIQKAAKSVAHLDYPVAGDEGKVGLLSLNYPEPRKWSETELDIIGEMAGLIHLLLRDARSQETLKKNEAIFRQFAEHIQSVFWMTDPDNNEMIYVSPAYDQVWGVPRERLKTHPRSFLDSIIPEDRSRVLDSLQYHRIGPYEKTYRIRQPNGSLRWIKDRSYPIQDDKGEVYRVVGIAEDITVLREAQERLEATQAQVVSNAKFAALGEMASGIAHEINNPLAVIQGLSVQLREICLRQQNPDQMLLESLETVEKMSRRIATIIKGLRTFSRRTDWDPMLPTDLNVILQETLAMCEAKLQEANVVLNTHFPNESCLVCCRSAEISQVLVNLLNNALDAVGESEQKTITLSVERRGGRILFRVSDSGPGIDPSVRDRIFQPFFTTKEVGKGTGLGLSISKGIVEAHGGKLYIDTESKYTCFVMELPTEGQ